MEKYYFSPSAMGFYAENLREQYEASKAGWPEDAIELSDQEYQKIKAGMENGMLLAVSDTGKPVLVSAVKSPD